MLMSEEELKSLIPVLGHRIKLKKAIGKLNSVTPAIQISNVQETQQAVPQQAVPQQAGPSNSPDRFVKSICGYLA